MIFYKLKLNETDDVLSVKNCLRIPLLIYQLSCVDVIFTLICKQLAIIENVGFTNGSNFYLKLVC